MDVCVALVASFVGNPRAGVQASFDYYADIVELKALTTLIGPSGVKSFDYILLTNIARYLETVKDCLRTNEAILRSLVRSEYLQ